MIESTAISDLSGSPGVLTERPTDFHPGQEITLRQRELGQFLTPAPLAEFMAGMFVPESSVIRILDAGAGVGALSTALVRSLCSGVHRPQQITITAYEVDKSLTPTLRENYSRCAKDAACSGIHLSFTVHEEDFIAAAVPLVRGDLFSSPEEGFDVAIVNPPYRKIRSDSNHRLWLRSAGIETTNLYTAFLSLIARLLTKNGQMIAITPRSFCNGLYFRPFREDFLRMMAINRVHIFDSRSSAFSGDNVLQENVILHARKSNCAPISVIISHSTGEPESPVLKHEVPFSQVVGTDDPQKFIHVVSDESQAGIRAAVGGLQGTLLKLGLTVSTGRVVEFRAAGHLRDKPGPGIVPLIHPCHFRDGKVDWPKVDGRRANGILLCEETRASLIPARTYVLVKRFTSKEERRRVVACVIQPSHLPGHEMVGLENHLNYFHSKGEGLPLELAQGMAAYLNSSIVDLYFRQFNGHTQINATDLRSISYPTRTQLVALGRKVGFEKLDQARLDAIVEKELNVTR